MKTGFISALYKGVPVHNDESHALLAVVITLPDEDPFHASYYPDHPAKP